MLELREREIDDLQGAPKIPVYTRANPPYFLNCKKISNVKQIFHFSNVIQFWN